MAIAEHRYACLRFDRTNNKVKPQPVVHTVPHCPTIGEATAELVTVIEGSITHRGHKFKVKDCGKCPPVLDWNWQDKAACRGIYDAIDCFRGQHTAARFVEKCCDHCPVVLECALFALDMGDAQLAGGVWGGVHIPGPNNPKRHRAAVKDLKAKAAILQQSSAA